MRTGAHDGLSKQCVTRRRNARGDGHRLRGEILEAAHVALEEAGSPRDLLLDRVADRLGVTTPSLYLHFRDKQDLVRTLADEALARLCRELESAGRDLGLKSCAEAYIQYAVANPAHYRLALLGTDRGPTQQRLRMASVVDRLEPFVADHLRRHSGTDSADVQLLTMELFAVTHGIASLLPRRLQTPADVVAIVDRTLCPLLRRREASAWES